MNIELRQLSLENGMAEYNMLQEIETDEYGFTNEVKGLSFQQYKKWLKKQDDYSKELNLPENFIPQTTYFFYLDNNPVGIARIRHYPADFLEKQGVGNFGYAIAKSYRGKGYGSILFAKMLEKCLFVGGQKWKKHCW